MPPPFGWERKLTICRLFGCADRFESKPALSTEDPSITTPETVDETFMLNVVPALGTKK